MNDLEKLIENHPAKSQEIIKRLIEADETLNLFNGDHMAQASYWNITKDNMLCKYNAFIIGERVLINLYKSVNYGDK